MTQSLAPAYFAALPEAEVLRSLWSSGLRRLAISREVRLDRDAATLRTLSALRCASILGMTVEWRAVCGSDFPIEGWLEHLPAPRTLEVVGSTTESSGNMIRSWVGPAGQDGTLVCRRGPAFFTITDRRLPGRHVRLTIHAPRAVSVVERIWLRDPTDGPTVIAEADVLEALSDARLLLSWEQCLLWLPYRPTRWPS
jgi:hypothetical protein